MTKLELARKALFDPLNHESRLGCMRAWVAYLEEQESPK